MTPSKDLTMMYLDVQLTIKSGDLCNKDYLMMLVWLGVGTKATWLGLDKVHNSG